MKDIKTDWVKMRDYFAETAERTRDSQSVSFNLLDEYDKLTEEDKAVVHEILAEWLMSEDNTLRYDSSFLISQRDIKTLKDTVEKAIDNAHRRIGPEAIDEAEDLERILNKLK
jgi:hypothetical protein